MLDWCTGDRAWLRDEERGDRVMVTVIEQASGPRTYTVALGDTMVGEYRDVPAASLYADCGDARCDRCP